MAAPFTISDVPGVDLVSIILAADIASGAQRPFARLGTQTWGSDGKQYVYGIAGGSIPASTAVCTVNPATFSATSSGGAYTSPATAMATGDYAWFAKASV
jgi:hypothetical protein